MTTRYETLTPRQAHVERRLDLMTEEYTAFVKCEGLPERSADDFEPSSLTDLQRRYLAVFIERWEALEKERNEANPDKPTFSGICFSNDNFKAGR